MDHRLHCAGHLAGGLCAAFPPYPNNPITCFSFCLSYQSACEPRSVRNAHPLAHAL